MTLNKLQIRAKILPILAELKAEPRLSYDVFIMKTKELHEIEDFDTFFEILCKELSKVNEDKYIDILRAMILEFIPREMFETKALEILKMPDKPDMLKYQLIQTLKTVGKEIDYEELFEYLEDAQSIINYDTEKLLEHAVVNPETQIDFLDFLSSLQHEDKTLLIDSLAADYTGNNLANILAPVLYSDFPENVHLKAISILGETKSPLAIKALEYLHEITDNDIVRTNCKKSLNMLKLSGATKEAGEKFYKAIMAESTPYKCYTGIPDGHYNQGFLFSRKRSDGTLMMFSVVISKIYGIVDSFGFFNTTEEEYARIALRFGQNEVRFEVSPEYFKKVLDEAFELTKKRRESIRYEAVCWSMLTCDIIPEQQSEKEWVEENINEIPINQKIVNLLYETNYLDKWFFAPKDHDEFNNLINDFTENKNLNFDYVEEKTAEVFDKIWDKETEELFLKNIYTTCYLFGITGFTDYSKILYSVLFHQDLKRKMQEDIIKKSVYEYFFNLKETHKEFKFPANIFRRKNKNEETTDIKTVEAIITGIEEKWVEQQ